MDDQQLQAIYELRDRKLSPKLIARKLGLRPAEVSAAIRARATADAIARRERGELDPLKACLINASAAQHLLNVTSEDGIEDEDGGMAQIIIARKDRSQLQVCSFLVDYWCLGIKNALGPRSMGTEKFVSFTRTSYQAFEQPGVEITLEQAWSVIEAAIAYARDLGFEPHKDFEKAKAILGQPPEQLTPVTCGRDGQPCYFAGPYDNAQRIVKQLREKVGEGNFNFVMPME